MSKTISHRPRITNAMLGVLAANIAAMGAADGYGFRVNDNVNTNIAEVTYAANETRFVEANFSEPLTAYAVGWSDKENILATLNFLAPDVEVARRFEFAKGTNSDDFLSETDDIRAIGSAFKRVEFTSSKVNEKTLNKGLTIRVDLDQVAGMPNWREQYTSRLMKRLFRNELIRAYTLANAAATNTAKTWDGSAGQDPDMDIQARIIAAADVVGITPNRALFGHGAWHKRQLTLRAQNTPAGYDSSKLVEAGVAGLLMLDGVKVSKERYASSASAKTKVVADVVLLFNAQDGLTTEDASHLKRFVSNTDSGGKIKVYEQQVSSKFIDITVEHYSNIVVTSALGIQKLTIS